MKKRAQLCTLNLLLIVLAFFGIFALYMNTQTQKAHDEAAISNTADYDYDEIQEMVTLSDSEPATERSAPYNTEELLALNSDFKGWLWIPETSVNYPVVQTEDNNTYLYRSFQGAYSSFGSLFLDQSSIAGSRNRVIHGHNMGNGRTEMFSELINYQDREWAGEREYAFFTEPDTMEDNEFRLFAVLNFNVNDLDEFNYLRSDFDSEDDFQTFTAYFKEQSLYTTEFIPHNELLILSTCNRAYGADNRLLICFGR